MNAFAERFPSSSVHPTGLGGRKSLRLVGWEQDYHLLIAPVNRALGQDTEINFAKAVHRSYKERMGKQKLVEYFEEVETIEEYNGYFCSIPEAISIVVLGSICGLRNTSQIHQWAERWKVCCQKIEKD